jgi:ABC-2 type transport system permease protein
LALILIPPLWNSEYVSGFNYMTMAIMYGGFLIARGILNDKIDGSIVRILAAPVTTLNYLVQNLMACMAVLLTQIIIVVTLGSILYDWDASFALLLGLCYTIFASATVTFSFAWSCLFKNKEVSYAIFAVVMSVIALLCGLWIPLEILPDTLRYIGALFPAYWASSGIGNLLATGVSAEYWLSMLAMLFFASAYLLYGGKRRII